MAGHEHELSRTETATLLATTVACLAILANTLHGDGEPLVASLALSGVAFTASYAMIVWLGPTFIKAGLKGEDMSKTVKRTLPECMGAICCVVYMLILIVFIPFPFYKDIVAATSGGGNRDVVLQYEYVHKGRFLHRFPHGKVSRDRCPSSPRAHHPDASSPNSSHPSSRPLSLYNPSPSSALATTSSTSDGDTSSSSQRLRLCPC